MDDLGDSSVCKDTWSPEFDIWNLNGGRREPIPMNCLLTISKWPHCLSHTILCFELGE